MQPPASPGPTKRKRQTTPLPDPARLASNWPLTPPTSHKKPLLLFPSNHAGASSTGDLLPSFLEVNTSERTAFRGEMPMKTEDERSMPPDTPMQPVAGYVMWEEDNLDHQFDSGVPVDEETPVQGEDAPAVIPNAQLQSEAVVVKVEDEHVSIVDIPLREGDALASDGDAGENVVEAEVGNVKAEEVDSEGNVDGDANPLIKQELTIKAEEPTSLYRTPADWGIYGDLSIDEIPANHLRMLCETGQIDNTELFPGLREAVIAWASAYRLSWGKHIDKLLEDIPMAYINRFMLNNETKPPRDNGLCVALKYHLQVRRPEEPGSMYRLTFGKFSGYTLEETLAEGEEYVEWIKSEGVAEQEGYEDLAEAVEYLSRQELAVFMERNPGVDEFEIPGQFLGTAQGLCIAQVTEYQIYALEQLYSPDRLRYHGLDVPITYHRLLRATSRWNWRRTTGPKSSWDSKSPRATDWWSKQRGLGPLLYPTTRLVPLREEAVVKSRGRTKWQRYFSEYSPRKGTWKWMEVNGLEF